MKKLFYSALFYMILGQLFGVFYREYTKMNDFTGITQLSTVHTHAFTLGMFFFLIVLALDKGFSLSSSKNFSKWVILYNAGLLGVLTTMTIRGIGQVNGTEIASFNYIAGLSHTIFAVAVVWFFVMLKKKI